VSNVPDAVIKIDLKNPITNLSPAMYGIFFEDINHAADGGLYAEMIQNRDFEYNRVPERMHWINDSTIVNAKGWKEIYRKPAELFSWSLILKGPAEAKMSLEKDMPFNISNPQYLKFNITKLNNGSAAISNNGFWGISVVKNENYSLSFYAKKSFDYNGKLKITLEGVNGEVYATTMVDGLTAVWKQFKTKLTSNANDPHAHFVIYAQSTGALWFDMVSLFPEKTFNNRPNGMRNDLAQMLADLKPSFLRFPGGCVVEGATIENRIQWKKTIGNLTNRQGHWNLWGYHTTDGLGFHEYLQLCEDLHVDPMYVINVGMSCQSRESISVSKDSIKVFLRETLDALEYAMGPVNTKWGGLRSINGHPAPFKIKYVEIGNENSGSFYQMAYKIIQPAIKSRYPDIITIADEVVPLTPEDIKAGIRVEMVDEHYYQSPAFFYNQSVRYDKYNRSNPWKVYIGEFAVTTGKPGNGNMRAALGEAAFMTGMERNSDIVKMASYAPTFVNVNDRKWNPDMIIFNSSQVYGTPSYHAIKLFSTNRPDNVLSTVVTLKKDASFNPFANLKGKVALSTWNTEVEYKDVKIEKDGKILLTDDFSNGVQNWNIKQDKWEIKDGAFKNNQTVTEAIAIAGDSTWTDYTFTVKARKIKGDEGFIIYTLMNGGNKCIWNIGGWNNTVNVLQQDRDESRVNLGSITPINIETGKWYELKMEIKGQNVKCYLDGKLCHDEKLREQFYPSIYSTAGIQVSTGIVIVKIVNPFETKRQCNIVLDGAAKFDSKGEAIVLSADKADDENSFTNPSKISPKQKAININGSSFNYECPPNSVTVLRLKQIK
jgi:alpha-L-arabinofuranosidase